MPDHHYHTHLEWTGNLGSGTSGYTDYSRDYLLRIDDKMDLPGSADPAFRGNPSLHNPEELLLASLSACHMLWYLHLCADNGIKVLSYTDHAKGTMTETKQGGHFTEVWLHPVVEIEDLKMESLAIELHKLAHQHCFISNSCNFPVRHRPVILGSSTP